MATSLLSPDQPGLNRPSRSVVQPVAPSAAIPVSSGDWVVQLIAGLLAVVFLVGAGLTARVITKKRDASQLVVSMEGQQGMPPHVALATAALGTFRGLAVDVLWIRAAELQNLGQYFEAQTLSQWITTLQPRFPQVWVFQAHNLAYNIAATAEVPLERWNWVDRGIELLRSRGIPMNPTAPQLHDMLSFIFHHKIGAKVDREHWYLKARLTSEMQEVLGDMAVGKSTAEAIEAFRKVAEAPDSLVALRADSQAAATLDWMQQFDAEPDEAFLRMLGRVVMVDSSLDAAILYGGGLPEGTNRPLIEALRAEPDRATAVFEKIVPFLQKQVLADRYRMDARRMLSLMERYGPLDWRHYDAHGIYWSELGLEVSQSKLRRDQVNELTILRTRLHTIADLMRSGRIDYDAVSDRIDLLPDPRFIASYETALQEARSLFESGDGVSAADFGAAEFADLARGYERFLNEAVILAFVYGEEQKAAECFKRLVLLARDQGKADQPIYRESLPTFVALRMGDVLKLDLSKTREFVDGMLQRALLDGLAKGRVDVFGKFVNMAFKVYEKKYNSRDPQAKVVLKGNDIGSFPDLMANSYVGMMTLGDAAVLERARIWAWTPDELRKRVWPELEGKLAQQATAAGLDPTRAFPPPPGVGEPEDTSADGQTTMKKTANDLEDQFKAESDRSQDGSDAATRRRNDS